MNKVLLILLFTTSLFSQRLWEIEVNPNDYLRDVIEIPNSDLLLFTYNTGKLEIRNSKDGSFVNQLIKMQNETGELRITNNGQLYYYQIGIDTIFFRDIISNDIVIKVSPEIVGLEGDPKFDSKAFQGIELFNNNTKLVGNMVYVDKEDSRNNVNYFIVYDIPSRTVEYKDDPYDERYLYIDKRRLSPDDKYYIETSYNKPIGRIFNLETKEYDYEINGEVSDEESYKLGALKFGMFQGNNNIFVGSGSEYIYFTFPNLDIINRINFFYKHNLFISQPSSNSLCNDISILNVHERYPNEVTKYYRYFIKYNFNSNEIIYSSKEYQTNLDYCYVFTVDNCNKLIVDRDYDYREGIIACYDYNTLDIEKELESNIYPNPTSNIINIDLETPTNITLFDIFGNKLLEDYNTKLDISHLSPGTYYVRYLGQTRMVVKI